MPVTPLPQKAGHYLQKLCVEIPGRGVGSQGNQTATDFFAATVATFGFAVDTPTFECIDWTEDGADLTVAGAPFAVFPSPYSLGCRANAPLAVVTTVDELAATDPAGAIVLLRGEIAGEQLMPKNFPFYNPDSHRRIIHLLESKQPQAIVAATSRDTAMVGATYPFPLIEDGDFDVPSVYMTEEEGHRLARHAGERVSLESRATRIPSTGCNVIARKGANRGRRVVLFAHVDAKRGTPGALDNATGVVTLLLLAELLSDYTGDLGIELVALNGEDYFSAPGEQQYLAQNEGRFDEIFLGINLDGVGYVKGRDAYSLYGCPDALAATIHEVFAGHDTLVEGDSWYQGDHSLFVMQQRPALAITSDHVEELLAEIVHTPADRPAIVDVAKPVNTAQALRELLLRLASR